MSSALCLLALLAAGWAASRTTFDTPKFLEVFQQVHVEPPLVTLFVLNHYVTCSILLLLAAIGCVFLTWRRGDRRGTLWVNIGCFLLATAWLGLVQFALMTPMISLLEGIGTRRR